jgi:DNA-binding HxlR family transcriptional regulator
MFASEVIVMNLYGQYCRVARASELLADRWTLLIIRELLADIRRFNDLDRGLPGISRALLVERLRRLEQSGVVQRRGAAPGRPVEYYLTDAGRQLQRVIDVLGSWGARWAFGEPRAAELDPVVLLWWMKRRVYQHRLPASRIVIQFDFHGERTGTYWLILERSDVSVCLQHPKFDIDLRVVADIRTFYRVWLGRIPLAETVDRRAVRLDGAPQVVRGFARWFAWSPMAPAVRAALRTPSAARRRHFMTTDRPPFPTSPQSH